MPSVNSQYNPYGSSGPMPISEPLLAISIPKQSEETATVQQQLADGDNYFILKAEREKGFIEFSFKVGEKIIKATALITEPKDLETLNTKNIVSIYLLTNNSNSTNAENRLDLEPEYMEPFKQKIIDAIFGNAKPLEDFPHKAPNGNGRSFRENSLHAEVKPILVA